MSDRAVGNKSFAFVIAPLCEENAEEKHFVSNFLQSFSFSISLFFARILSGSMNHCAAQFYLTATIEKVKGNLFTNKFNCCCLPIMAMGQFSTQFKSGCSAE